MTRKSGLPHRSKLDSVEAASYTLVGIWLASPIILGYHDVGNDLSIGWRGPKSYEIGPPLQESVMADSPVFAAEARPSRVGRVQPVGEVLHGRVAVLSNLGYGYIVDSSGRQYAVARKFVGPERYDVLQIDQSVSFRSNGHNAVAVLV